MLNTIDPPFVCFACGNEFSYSELKDNDSVVAALRFDKGESNYPITPDEPSSFYFECIDCYNKERYPPLTDSRHGEQATTDSDSTTSD